MPRAVKQLQDALKQQQSEMDELVSGREIATELLELQKPPAPALREPALRTDRSASAVIGLFQVA